MALAQRAGLGELAGEYVRVRRPCGVNAQVKVGCLVAGMIAGADSIEDMGLLRHGGLPDLFGGLRAPSTLGSFLRSFTWGNVLQLGKVHLEVLAELARRAPLLPGADVLAFVDIDSQLFVSSMTAWAGAGSGGGARPDALSRGCPPWSEGVWLFSGVRPDRVPWRGVAQEGFAQLEIALPVLAGK